ncbi:hypothetical protein ISS07_02710 [Candidatus Woesearchaeota archaeon]|nr:hypothetical protein [Candidatus Woesearchaeota archaeon]
MSERIIRLKKIFLIVVFVFVALFLFHSFNVKSIYLNYYFEKEIGSHASTLEDTYYSQGLDGAFEYVDSELWGNANYGVSHMVLHEFGHLAWEDVKNFSVLISKIPYKNYSSEEFWKYEGYYHGVMHSFFYESNKDNLSETSDDACGLFDKGEGINDFVSSLMFKNCYHAAGHGMLVASQGNLDVSLERCDAVERKSYVLDCYEGVFMENAFLQLPWYSSYGVSNEGLNLVEVCSNFEGNKSLLCSQFIAWTEIVKTGNIKASFGKCFSLEKDDRFQCIFLPSRHFLPLVYKNSYEKMIEVCSSFPEQDYRPCILGIASGIKQSGTGNPIHLESFCDIAGNDFKEECNSIS